MPTLRFLDSAVDDIAAASTFIAQTSGSKKTGERFATQLFDKCEHLASLPGMMGRPRPELGVDIRSTAHKGYVIFFRYIGDVFEVVNILEGHLDIEAFFSTDHS